MLPLRFLRITDRGTPRSFTTPACLLLLASAPLWLAGCDDSPAHPASAPPAATAATASAHREGADIVVPADSPLRERLVVAAVRSQAVEQPIAAPGTIEALPDHLARIAPPVTGRVVELHRALGDPVRAGDVLFTLDSSDLSAARGDAARARDAAAQAGRDLDRQQLLFDADIAARKDLEAAQLARAQAANDLRTAQARLAQLGASVDDNAGRRLSVHAPLAGRVIEMNAAPGSYWNDVNAPLMTIADLSRVSVTAAVPEKDLARIFVGQSAQVVLNAYPDDPRAGTVRYIGEVLDPDTRTVKVRLILDNADGRLRPGMFVKLRFAGPSHPAPVVPASALLQEGLFTRVFVERAPGRYVAREVSVGAALGDQVEIVSGLRPGERVVVRDGVLLHD
ncbi:membrane fusion protein, cobalt-zinc-cadmium efflux system [Mitsuaria sp. PDC51]|uniref:efflux RND transporter periplasmic adaptor subunit n=1 Tax=Mitsuaria sp. PDC51 TaxID=1881035 RepID=UPI0008ED7073|nr:efflux RND transporter periplasmic adaptor subunit [Mitsuaria sp. PDC51]SFR73037.1 membrane fusion protein, cobalt-zinc-cadmium efflux system [Mitsuaria sp. PDC51]